MPFAVSYIALTVYPILLIFRSIFNCQMHIRISFPKGSPFYHLKTAEAVRGKWQEANSCVSFKRRLYVPEGCVPRKIAGQKISGRCELLTDEAQAEEPGAHGVFGVLVLLGLRACRPHILCHLA